MFIIWLGMIVIAAVEIPTLLEREKRGELLAFTALWVVATLYASLVAADVALPNPTEFLISLFGGQQ